MSWMFFSGVGWKQNKKTEWILDLLSPGGRTHCLGGMIVTCRCLLKVLAFKNSEVTACQGCVCLPLCWHMHKKKEKKNQYCFRWEIVWCRRITKNQLNYIHKQSCAIIKIIITLILRPTRWWLCCDQHVHGDLLLSCGAPVPASISHLQFLEGYSESPSSVITDGHWSVFVFPFRTCQQAGAPVSTPTPPLLALSVGKQSAF